MPGFDKEDLNLLMLGEKLVYQFRKESIFSWEPSFVTADTFEML